MTLGFRARATRRIVMAALGAAVLAGVPAPSGAADLGLVPRHHVKRVTHVWTSRVRTTWLDRCAHAGYYCLYAEYGYVYHYPFDSRPIARAHYRRRYR